MEAGEMHGVTCAEKGRGEGEVHQVEMWERCKEENRRLLLMTNCSLTNVRTFSVQIESRACLPVCFWHATLGQQLAEAHSQEHVAFGCIA